MTNRRNRQRFYPEFYSYEEMGKKEAEKSNDKENDINEQKEENLKSEMNKEEPNMEEQPEQSNFPIVRMNSDKSGKIREKSEEDESMQNDVLIYPKTSVSILTAKSNDLDILGEINQSEEPEPEEMEATSTFAELVNPIPNETVISEEPGIISEPLKTNVIANPDLIPFDREKAVEYARRWALDRNPDYFDFDALGGDCTNYISQILLAGGCLMDKSSVIYGWYYNTANDKSPSWTGVEQLYDYLLREKDYGISAVEVDLNSVEAGDIAQLSFNGKTYQHTPFITSVKRDPDGTIGYDGIKICAHSFDSENRPLDTYQWKNIRFIRIFGFKQ